jgi:rod shape-determining protein MreC
VARRSGSFTTITEPFRSFWHRFSYGLLIAAAFGLLVLGKADIVLVERTRTAIVDATAPILDILSRPAATVSDVLQQFRELRDLRTENARLREENARLQQWQQAARLLEAENRSLRSLTSYIPDPAANYVTGRVIGDSGGPFVRSVLVNVGSRDGVEKGQAAMTGQGLAGRIAEVGYQHARALLITDLNSRIPVIVENSRDRAILAGDNTVRPKLLYLDSNAKVSPGDRIVTSGHAGALPPGLPVGIVISVSDHEVRVKPFVEWHKMEYLRLVDFHLPPAARGETIRQEAPQSPGRR